VKPTVSANASQTYLFSANEARRVMTSLRSKSDHDAYLVQPYLSEIETDGEWSLMFFGGEYSHSVRKLPKAGDFRVQSGHGGRSEPMVPSQLILDAAHRAVNLGVPTSMYARVDGVVHDGQFLVMELEVIEPELFFRADPQAAGRFADRLLAYVKA
jgi:glutathione synthase/RimK-type ligase-like ATP-grasp enzyme